MQDALVRGLAALHQFQVGTSLKAWLFTILRNAFYEQRRRTVREAAKLAAAGTDEAVAAPAQDHRQTITDLQTIIWTLPPLLREALILVGVQELSHEEAALVCNVPVGTMKARLSRARVALGKAMRSQAGEQC